METSAASSTTCASPTCLLAECSRNTRTFVSHTSPSSPVRTSKPERSWGELWQPFVFAVLWSSQSLCDVQTNERTQKATHVCSSDWTFPSSCCPLSDLTMATTSGKSKASCSAANAAHPSAGTHQRHWRPCRRTARPRTSSSPARRPTPALRTVPPAPLKTLHTLSLASCTHDRRTHEDASPRPL